MTGNSQEKENRDFITEDKTAVIRGVTWKSHIGHLLTSKLEGQLKIRSKGRKVKKLSVSF